MKKIILTLLLGTLCFSCGSDKKHKKADAAAVKAETKTVKEIPEFNFPVVDNLLSNPNLMNITDVSHSFEDDIVFSEINVLKTDNDTYTFIFVLDETITNFEKLKTWKIGMYFYAKDPKKFLKSLHQTKGFKTMGTLATPKLMGKEVVIVLENFKIVPKEISLLRLYLYNNNNESIKKYYNTKDIVLP